MIVDAHSHVSLSWYEPVETLLFQMDQSNVDKAVLVQMWSELDNGYQTECVRRFPDRFASVVMVDTESSDAVSDLKRLADEGAKGVRMRPLTRSTGNDPLALWRAAEKLGISASCVGSPNAFASEEFEQAIREVPNLPIVIEHIGEILPADPGYDPAVADRIFNLSRFDNVYIKIHGLGEFAVRNRRPTDGFPFLRPVPDLITRAYSSFGANRMMWGSDYPPVSKREGYANSLTFARRELAHVPEHDLNMIFGGTAASLYGLGSASELPLRSGSGRR
ncbi:amidohydrolase family protein [Arthrobacter bambusae]|uniref:amidohydrolase family protein n=1 Tax=Arthrobacter bambusae TaxID=1338426 RepID=UPI001F50A552|nr:amidohydrolase family protein [Arthrobacter bambusae]MCI0144077.1 amidohydrolase family protein [Arthrobacter bambusae]